MIKKSARKDIRVHESFSGARHPCYPRDINWLLSTGQNAQKQLSAEEKVFGYKNRVFRHLFHASASIEISRH